MELVKQHKNVFFTGNAGKFSQTPALKLKLLCLVATLFFTCLRPYLASQTALATSTRFCAGTGKSFLLNHIIVMLKELYGPDFADSVAVCAATGIAATHIGGEMLALATGPACRDLYVNVVSTAGEALMHVRCRDDVALIIRHWDPQSQR